MMQSHCLPACINAHHMVGRLSSTPQASTPPPPINEPSLKPPSPLVSLSCLLASSPPFPPLLFLHTHTLMNGFLCHAHVLCSLPIVLLLPKKKERKKYHSSLYPLLLKPRPPRYFPSRSCVDVGLCDGARGKKGGFQNSRPRSAPVRSGRVGHAFCAQFHCGLPHQL